MIYDFKVLCDLADLRHPVGYQGRIAGGGGQASGHARQKRGIRRRGVSTGGKPGGAASGQAGGQAGGHASGARHMSKTTISEGRSCANFEIRN